MTASEGRYQAIILEPGRPADDTTLAEFRRDPGIQFIQDADAQRPALRKLTPTPGPGLVDEPTRWSITRGAGA